VVVSSAQVPLWVTIAVAFVGFVGVLTAQFIAAWREDRRWRRDQVREEIRWTRERAREVDNRDFEGRQNAYAQVISAVEGYDWLVYPAIAAVRRGAELSSEEKADVWRARDELRQSLGPVNLYASQKFSVLLRDSNLPRSRLAMYLTTGSSAPEPERVRELWAESQLGYRRMRAEMRKDLGLDAEDVPEPPKPL
jgi:hypothetical protein